MSFSAAGSDMTSGIVSFWSAKADLSFFIYHDHDTFEDIYMYLNNGFIKYYSHAIKSTLEGSFKRHGSATWKGAGMRSAETDRNRCNSKCDESGKQRS